MRESACFNIVLMEMMGSVDQRKDHEKEVLQNAWKWSVLDMWEEILEENVLLEEKISTTTSSQVVVIPYLQPD